MNSAQPVPSLDNIVHQPVVANRANSELMVGNDVTDQLGDAMSASSVCLNSACDRSQDVETQIEARVRRELARSGFPLKNVECSMHGRTLRLTGRVTRYFHVQMALEIGMAHSNGCRVEVAIDVVPSTTSAREVWQTHRAKVIATA